MAEQFAREYSLYSDLEELVSLITDPYSTNETATVSLCSQYFYVDVCVSEVGGCRRVDGESGLRVG